MHMASFSHVRQFAALMILMLALIACELADFFPAAFSTEMPPTTPPIADTSPCGFMWAEQPLPDVTAQAQAAVDTVLENVNVYASAYGENCINQDGSVRYFAAMTTDFEVLVPVDSFTDTDALAEIVTTLSDTLSALEGLPARTEWLDIVFQSDGREQRLHLQLSAIQRALADGLRGAALLAALGWET